MGELASLFGSVEAAEFVVTFQMEQTDGTDAFTGKWTWYQDPAGDRGVPLLMEFESPDGDFRLDGSFVALSAEVQLRRASSGARAHARQNAATSLVKISWL